MVSCQFHSGLTPEGLKSRNAGADWKFLQGACPGVFVFHPKVQFEKTSSGVLFKFRPLTVKDVGGLGRSSLVDGGRARDAER